jgi:AraC-like DNA-binding protein
MSMTDETSDKRRHLAGSDDAALWTMSGLGGLELLKARYGRLVFAPHGHEEYFVAVTETGKAELRYRGDRHAIGPGDVVVLNPEEVHGGGPVESYSWGYRSLYAPAWLMADVARQLNRRHDVWFSADVIRDPSSAARLRDAHVAVERGETRLYQQSLLLRALVGLVALHSSDRERPELPRRHPAVWRTREYLDAHVDEDVTLSALAGIAGLSPYYLCSVFRRETGVPPHAYQIQMRVRRARKLILDGIPPADVATAVGFYDQAHMNRHFKRIVGMTPGEYRTAARRQRR